MDAASQPAPTTRQKRSRAWLQAAAPGQPCRIKTCGMSRDEDVDAVNEARPDLVGFIVDVPRSRRTVTPGRFSRLAGRVEVGTVGETGACVRVGVFVDEPLCNLTQIVLQTARRSIDVVQLHGHEDDAYVDELHERTGIGVIQAFQLHEEQDARRAQASHADLVLLDSGQGSGTAFDWSYARLVDRPFLLAGGLAPLTIARAVAEVHPWGVDLSSGLESGVHKDPAKIRAAVEAVRELNARPA
ncbi:MAG: phosphoribosylanthranilate isomerase [Coriobacteriales bacterium]